MTTQPGCHGNHVLWLLLTAAVGVVDPASRRSPGLNRTLKAASVRREINPRREGTAHGVNKRVRSLPRKSLNVILHHSVAAAIVTLEGLTSLSTAPHELDQGLRQIVGSVWLFNVLKLSSKACEFLALGLLWIGVARGLWRRPRDLDMGSFISGSFGFAGRFDVRRRIDTRDRIPAISVFGYTCGNWVDGANGTTYEPPVDIVWQRISSWNQLGRQAMTVVTDDLRRKYMALEFAAEIIVKSSTLQARIREVPDYILSW